MKLWKAKWNNVFLSYLEKNLAMLDIQTVALLSPSQAFKVSSSLSPPHPKKVKIYLKQNNRIYVI